MTRLSPGCGHIPHVYFSSKCVPNAIGGETRRRRANGRCTERGIQAMARSVKSLLEMSRTRIIKIHGSVLKATTDTWGNLA